MVNKIAAIKYLRQELGIGLREAKDVVDAAILRFLPEERSSWTEERLLLVESGRCVACDADLAEQDRGRVFCSAACYSEHAERVMRDNRVREYDRRVEVAERELAALKAERAALLAAE